MQHAPSTACSRGQQFTSRSSRQRFSHRLAHNRRVVIGLTAKPPAVAHAKLAAQPQVGICRDGAFTGDDVADALRGHTDVLSQTVLCQAKRRQKFFRQHLTGGNRGISHITAQETV